VEVCGKGGDAGTAGSRAFVYAWGRGRGECECEEREVNREALCDTRLSRCLRRTWDGKRQPRPQRSRRLVEAPSRQWTVKGELSDKKQRTMTNSRTTHHLTGHQSGIYSCVMWGGWVLRSGISLAPAIIDSLAAQRARFEAMASSTNECSAGGQGHRIETHGSPAAELSTRLRRVIAKLHIR